MKHGVLLAFSNSFSGSSRSTLPWSDNWLTGIAPGGSRVQTTNNGRGNCPTGNSKWLAQSGTYTVYAWVDDTDSSNAPVGYVREISDSNNYKNITFTVP